METAEPTEEIVLRHLKSAGELYRLIDITQFLVTEIKEKKSGDARAKAYMRNYLYKRGEEVSTLPYVREALEKNLTKELGTQRSSFKDVYYHHKQKPYECRFDQFTKYEWKLSPGEEMSEYDEGVMEKYRNLFIGVVEKYAPRLKKHKKARKEIEKLVEAFSLINK